MDQQRPRNLRLPFVVLLILVAVVPGGLARPQAAPGAAQGPTVTLNPSSGLPGSSVSISAMYLPATTTGLLAGIGFEVDGKPVSVGQQMIVTCATRAIIYGFGADCTGNDVTFQVPETASPGAHTVIVAGSFLDFVGQFLYSSTFTVLAPPTDTPSDTPTETPTATPTAPDSPTPTPTATNTPSQTPTATASSQPSSTPSATVTDSPTPISSQASTTAPTATVVPTIVITPGPKAAGMLLLARPDFTAGALLVSMLVQPEATIHIVFSVGDVNKGQARPNYSLTQDDRPDVHGRYATLLHIAYRKSGQATLLVSIRTGSVVQTMRRQYWFSPN